LALRLFTTMGMGSATPTAPFVSFLFNPQLQAKQWMSSPAAFLFCPEIRLFRKAY
jgi:hypothetical protein